MAEIHRAWWHASRRRATYHVRMPDPIPHHAMPAELAGAARHLVAGWWGIVRLGALLLDMALSRATYSRENWRRLALHIVQDAGPMLAGFTVLTTLISLILIRIVLVTALSYGLTQYALEMVVRVLVLELIPLTAALFAALRCTIPNAVEVDHAARARSLGELGRCGGRDAAPRGPAARGVGRVQRAAAGRGQLRGDAGGGLPRRSTGRSRRAWRPTRARWAMSSTRRCR